MVFSRSRKGSGEQGKSLEEMGGEVTSGLSGIVELSLTNECQGQIINRGHDFAELPNRHAGGIFLEGNIAAVMQTGLNAPMGATKTQ